MTARRLEDDVTRVTIICLTLLLVAWAALQALQSTATPPATIPPPVYNTGPNNQETTP